MITTHEVFGDRKNEIEFYYSVMVDIDDETKNALNTIDNQRFFRIMKSNFLLMLYNLVEATFTTGMLEIYEQLEREIVRMEPSLMKFRIFGETTK